MTTRLSLAAVLLAAAPAAAQPFQLTEDFTAGNHSVAQLQSRGWVLRNNSIQPDPAFAWGPGFSRFDQPQYGTIPSGPPNTGSYWASDLGATMADPGDISDWLLTPTVGLQAGYTFSFFTVAGGDAPDRMQVRLSTSGASTNVGTTTTSVGDFTTLLLDINPTLTDIPPDAYPLQWTQYSITLTAGQVPSFTTGRLAFRYFVPNSSFNNGPADAVAIDNVRFTGVPEPTSLALVGLAVGVGAWRRRRKA